MAGMFWLSWIHIDEYHCSVIETMEHYDEMDEQTGYFFDKSSKRKIEQPKQMQKKNQTKNKQKPS